MLNYASTYILTLILVNLLVYCIFYLAMKLVSGERPTCWVKSDPRHFRDGLTCALPKQAWAHFVLWCLFNCAAVFFFSKVEKSSDFSPAASRFSHHIGRMAMIKQNTGI